LREIRFTQTGDPWHDWGLCELYEALHDPSLQPYLHITLEGDAGFIVTTELSSRDFGEKVGSVLTSASRWNMLHPRFEEGKKIPRCEPRIVNGRRVPGEKYDEKVSKEEWEAADCRGEPPKIERERCKRLASVPLTPGRLEALMSPKGGKDSFADIAAKVLEPATAMSVTQGANPLVAKHHSNYNVRGILEYPKERRREQVSLTDTGRQDLERMLARIQEVRAMPEPPHVPEPLSMCGECAYQELCWG